MTGADRLDWIFDPEAGDQNLHERYDRWADSYDQDHDAWGWSGPEAVADAYLRAAPTPAGGVLDAGCGTGAAAAALRRSGYGGQIIGTDISDGMLRAAATKTIYDQLLRGSLSELPMATGSVGGVISSGVFTHGHVGGEALAELCRVTTPGGVISISQRLDVVEQYEPFADRLVGDGVWLLIDQTEPARFHPGRDDSEQIVVTFRVS